MTGIRRLGRAVRAAPANIPLRIQLVLALLSLVALALAATGFAATAALRTYLLDRVDGNLAASSHDVLERGGGGGPRPGDRGGPAMSTAFFTSVTDATGKGSARLVLGNDTAQTVPRLPALTAAEVTKRAAEPFTSPALGAGHRWRVLVTSLPGGGAVTVAISQNEVDDTVGRLRRIDLVVSLLVLVALAILGYAVVRRSLRGLVEVEGTAAAIAAGDLSRRVGGANSRTEVGRLASALNAMLAQIESAFSSQRASEASARASEERMRRFVADASHELRTPLTSIRGFAELHRQGAVPDVASVRRVMRRIEDEATRMGLLVEDLLLLARLDEQRPLERHPVDLLTIATDAVQDAQAIAPDHPTRLEVASVDGGSPPVVLGDDARLRQVVANLVSNAVTHTPQGTAVTVRVAGTSEYAELSVIDDGPGLEPESAARAFERFYRADPSRTRARGGTGLGLSIGAALVAAHGGTIDLETAPGAGATFTLRLPLYHAAASPATGRGVPDLEAEPAPDAGSKVTVGATPVGPQPDQP